MGTEGSLRRGLGVSVVPACSLWLTSDHESLLACWSRRCVLAGGDCASCAESCQSWAWCGTAHGSLLSAYEEESGAWWPLLVEGTGTAIRRRVWYVIQQASWRYRIAVRQRERICVRCFSTPPPGHPRCYGLPAPHLPTPLRRTSLQQSRTPGGQATRAYTDAPNTGVDRTSLSACSKLTHSSQSCTKCVPRNTSVLATTPRDTTPSRPARNSKLV